MCWKPNSVPGQRTGYTPNCAQFLYFLTMFLLYSLVIIISLFCKRIKLLSFLRYIKLANTVELG